MSRRWPLVSFLAVMIAVAVGAWLFRGALLARYHLYWLRHAPDAECANRIRDLLAHTKRLPGPLVDWLIDADEAACGRAKAAMLAWAETAGGGGHLVRLLHDRFTTFNPAGQCVTLELATQLAGGLSADELAGARTLAAAGCRAAEPPVRLRGLCLATRCDAALVPEVVPLLRDPSAEVRRAAVLAVGPYRDLVGDEELLRWLHDPDKEVRTLCATALRGRGLTAGDVVNGRLLTSPQTADRLQLVSLLLSDPDADVAAWLGRLAQDPEPAVRAAATRLAFERQCSGWADYVTATALGDPDPSVRRVAAHYAARSTDCKTAAYLR